MDDNSTQDIQQVADDEELFRRLTVWNQLAKKPDGSYRPSTAVYRSTLGDISVDIASKTTPEESIKGAIALIGIFAKEPKELGYPVIEEPIEENQAHALIKVGGRMRQSHARKLVGVSSWVIQPC